MKRATLFALAVFLAACASSRSSSSGPNVTVELAQLNSASDVFYMRGPVSIQYQLSITNPTSQPLTLTRLDLQTMGIGAYSLRANGTPMNLTVAPNSTSNYTISVWGYANGGYLASSAPVTMRGTAYFKGPSGSFLRMFNENIPQQSAG
jgi:hypothetical protein